MKYLLSYLFFIISLAPLSSQTYNFCGIWFGQNYPCYTIDENHMMHPYIRTEIIEIKQEGTAVTATKIKGDDCVTDGNITWYGDYTSNVFTVTFMAGSPHEPNSTVITGQYAFIIDSNRIGSSAGPLYIRASCSQIDSMQLDDNYLALECLDCDFMPDIVMPNVFTPNGDGINDYFVPIKLTGIKNGTLTIYNRWGNPVFKTQKFFKGWNGSYYGEECIDGTYYWVVDYTGKNKKTVYFNGFVTLIH